LKKEKEYENGEFNLLAKIKKNAKYIQALREFYNKNAN